jgi:hypothetical protein
MTMFRQIFVRPQRPASRETLLGVGIAVCVLLAVVQGPSGSSSGATRVSAAAGWSWFKTDPHVHSTFSADAFSDIGIHAVAAKAQGYNALFLTDHDGGSSFLINNETANHRVFEDKLTNWTASTFGTQSGSTNALATSPVASGTSSLHLASTSMTYGETGVWSTRGPNFRSGDIILKVKIYPKRIDANSGVYVSASIGGDLNVVKHPKGYTTTSGVITPEKTTVLVWQLGNARVASSDPNTRVITNSLGSYTLNQWNSYTINVTQAMAAIPVADRPLSYDAFTYLRMVAAAGNGGTADAYFDAYSIDAAGPIPPADEFVYRTPLVSAYDTSTFKIFSSYEMGQSKHSQRFNFAITSPSEYVHYANGIDGIRPTQDMGYPAQLNHPGTGTTIPEAIAGRGLGADNIEVTNPDWEAAWDEILKQGTQILGNYSSDTHSGESANSEATFIYAPALTFDDLIHSYYEGRSYSAVNSFAGRLIFNLDGSATEPYPARYPVYVPNTLSSRNVHFAVTAGLVSGYKVRWIRNGVAIATDSTTGASYDATKAIDLSGDPTYVRAEVLNGAGDVVAVTQPIFFRDVAGLPTGVAASLDQIVTTNGRGYNRILSQGITTATFDSAANRLDLTFVNPPNADARALLPTPSAPSSITVNSAPIDPVSGETEFNAAQGSSWYYDSATSIVHLKVRQPDSTSPTSTAAVAVSFGGGGGGGGGGSTTVTIPTDADAKVQSANPTTNYATSTLAVDGGVDPEKDVYLRFPVTGVTGTVTKVVLRVHTTSGSNNAPGVYASANSTWTETGLTWNTRPGPSGPALANAAAVATGVFFDYDVTGLLTGNGVTSVVLLPESNDDFLIDSRESTVAANRPQLIITTSGGAPGDTTAPSVPGGVTAAAAGSTAVDVSWQASTDDVGVTGYEVSRDGAVIAPSVTTTSYHDSTVAASTTYSYTVRARDAAGNWSAASTPGTVTTPAGGGGGTTVTIPTDADVKVQSANPTTNYATSTLAVDGGVDPEKDVYLRFPVTGLTGTVTKVVLRVHVSNGTNNAAAVYASANSTWTETGLTWNTRPGPSGPVLANAAAVATGAFLDYDVTGLLTGNGVTSVVLLPESNDDFLIDSRESTVTANRPQLIITTA